jgi:hypothetical protein
MKLLLYQFLRFEIYFVSSIRTSVAWGLGCLIDLPIRDSRGMTDVLTFVYYSWSTGILPKPWQWSFRGGGSCKDIFIGYRPKQVFYCV